MSESRKSISGFIIECANGKATAVVALSSCEANTSPVHTALANSCGYTPSFKSSAPYNNNPHPLYFDNQGTVAYNPIPA